MYLFPFARIFGRFFSRKKYPEGVVYRSAYDYVISCQGKVIAKTDIIIRVLDGTYGLAESPNWGVTRP